MKSCTVPHGASSTSAARGRHLSRQAESMDTNPGESTDSSSATLSMRWSSRLVSMLKARTGRSSLVASKVVPSLCPRRCRAR